MERTRFDFAKLVPLLVSAKTFRLSTSLCSMFSGQIAESGCEAEPNEEDQQNCNKIDIRLKKDRPVKILPNIS